MNTIFNSVATTAPLPSVSATLDTSLWFSVNSISRREDGRAVRYAASQTGKLVYQLNPATLDSLFVVQPAIQTVPVPETKLLYITTSAPVVCKVTVNSVVTAIPVTKLLVLDSPVANIQLENHSLENTVQVGVAYAT